MANAVRPAPRSLRSRGRQRRGSRRARPRARRWRRGVRCARAGPPRRSKPLRSQRRQSRRADLRSDRAYRRSRWSDRGRSEAVVSARSELSNARAACQAEVARDAWRGLCISTRRAVPSYRPRRDCKSREIDRADLTRIRLGQRQRSTVVQQSAGGQHEGRTVLGRLSRSARRLEIGQRA